VETVENNGLALVGIELRPSTQKPLAVMTYIAVSLFNSSICFGRMIQRERGERRDNGKVTSPALHAVSI
jgi:hypothetical protein